MNDSTKRSEPTDAVVGYGNPPGHTRFRRGTSGNPAGRPKGRKNLATLLERTLQEKIVIKENGVRKTVTKGEAAIKQLVNKAASGDLAAMRLLAALANTTMSTEIEKPVPAESDEKIMRRLLGKLEKASEFGDGNDK